MLVSPLDVQAVSIPTHELLKFQLAHAEAQDAVHQALDVEHLVASFNTLGLDSLTVHSQAENKQEYLKRPDLGHLLSPASQHGLEVFKASNRKTMMSVL